MTSAKNIVTDYKNLINGYQKQVRAYDNEMDGAFEELGEVTKYYDGWIEQLAEIRDAYVRDGRAKVSEIKRRHMALMDESLKSMGEIESIVNVLNGRAYRPIFDIKEENVVVRGSREMKVYYFDELFESEFLSLRAVIFSDVKREDAIQINYPNPVPYTLAIIGFAEHGKYRGNGVAGITVDGFGKNFLNVCYKVKEGFDLQKMIDFYEKNIKGFENKDVGKLKDNLFAKEWKIVKSVTETLKNMVGDEVRSHDFKNHVLDNYVKEDFEDILGAECPKCGKDFLTTRQVQEAQEHHLFCWHCGSKMVN